MMKLKITALLILGLGTFLLSSCDQAPKKGADNYYFEEKEFERTSLGVTVVLFQTRREFEETARQKLGKNFPVETVAAFGSLSTVGNNCTIYTMDASVQYEPEFLGHELAHCIWGRFHEKQNITRNRL
jgi:hypothetical protein